MWVMDILSSAIKWFLSEGFNSVVCLEDGRCGSVSVVVLLSSCEAAKSDLVVIRTVCP